VKPRDGQARNELFWSVMVVSSDGNVKERRLVFLLVDGIGDVALPQLCNLTPLQVASMPTFDRIAGGHV
jgi:hypothetical protein